MARKTGKNEVFIKKDTAKSLGLTVEEAVASVEKILEKYEIPKENFLSVLLKKGNAIVVTSFINIECDRNLSNPRLFKPLA